MSPPADAVAAVEVLVVVLHSVRAWLPPTMTWLHAHVSRLPVESAVFAHAAEAPERFPVNRLLLGPEPLPLVHRVAGRLHRRVGLELGGAWSPLGRAVRELRPRVVHSHFANRGWFDLPALRGAGTRHVVTFYGYDVNHLPVAEPAWRRRYTQLFARADRFFCEGPHMARCLVELGCPSEKVRVVHLGVDLHRFPFAHRLPGAGPVRVLVSGTFAEKKGIPDALEAVARWRARTGREVQVVLVGDAPREERFLKEKARVEAALALPELAGVVERTGYVTYERLAELTRSCHVFLAPSVHAADGDTEGGAPVTLIEAAASGLAVVATTHCDIPNVTRPELEALLAPERRPDVLAELLERLLTEGDAAWCARLDRARRRVETEFDVVTQAGRLAEQYVEVAGGG